MVTRTPSDLTGTSTPDGLWRHESPGAASRPTASGVTPCEHGITLGKAVGVFHGLGERVDPSRRRARPLGGAASSAALEHQGQHVTFSSRLRTTSLVAVLVALALTASACGGSDAKAADQPSTPASTSASPTPTSTPTPTPSAAPLSPFEGKAPVKAARAWAAAQAKAVNRGDRSMSSLAKVATAQGIQVSQKLGQGDIDHHYYLPGPPPFTPVSVQVTGGRARLNTCFWTFGWSVDRATKKRVNKRKIQPIVLEVVKTGGRWKFDNGYQGTGDCSGVTVKGVQW